MGGRWSQGWNRGCGSFYECCSPNKHFFNCLPHLSFHLSPFFRLSTPLLFFNLFCILLIIDRHTWEIGEDRDRTMTTGGAGKGTGMGKDGKALLEADYSEKPHQTTLGVIWSQLELVSGAATQATNGNGNEMEVSGLEDSCLSTIPRRTLYLFSHTFVS